ncbi:AbrB/MazE/SpoVT family DNA-binding domain-containing protein [Promicromonospora soli]
MLAHDATDRKSFDIRMEDPLRMKQKIITVGTSAGITISPGDLKWLGVSVGDTVEITPGPGTIEIRRVNERAHLSHDELMALVDEKFR